MTSIQSFRDLIVWQKAMDLAVRTYVTAQKLPKQEQSVLGYQLRKSAVSIPSNIAEGWGRRSMYSISGSRMDPVVNCQRRSSSDNEQVCWLPNTPIC